MSRAESIIPKLEDVAGELLKREKAKESLHEFVRQAWHVIEPGYEFLDSWHVQAVCEHLEACNRGDIKNFLLNMPPRSLKTTLVDIAFPAWVWINRPTEKFIYASYGYALAEDASIKCRALLRSRWFQARWGEQIQITEDRDTKEYFANAKGGERIITSVDGTLTGRGGDVIIVNDGNNVKDQSDILLENALNFWRTVVPTRLNEPKKGRRIVVQQRTHEKDISGYILANSAKDWTHMCLPMEFESARCCVTVRLPSTGKQPWRDPRTKEGELLHPARVGPKELAALKRDLGGEYAISGQLQQRPAPAAGGIIKKAWFKVWTQRDPPVCEFIMTSLDTAMSEAKKSAYSAATTWGVFRDDYKVPNVILLATWREQCEYPELRDRVKRLAKNYLDDRSERWKGDKAVAPDMLLIEAKSSGVSLIQDLARADVLATKFNPDRLGDKTQRVRLITPLLESGRVWVPGKGPDYSKPRDFADQFIEQCGSFPNAASRDLVDTMTQALWRMLSSGWVWNSGDPGPVEKTNDQPRQAIY